MGHAVVVMVHGFPKLASFFLVFSNIDAGKQPLHLRTEDGHKTVRVPVQAKDAVVIAGIAADKLRVSMGLPSRITGTADDGDRMEKLRKLAEASRAARKESSEAPTLQ